MEGEGGCTVTLPDVPELWPSHRSESISHGLMLPCVCVCVSITCVSICQSILTQLSVLIPAGPALTVVDLHVDMCFSVFILQVLLEVVSLPPSFLEKLHLVAFYDSAFSWFSFLPLSPI